MFAHVENSEAGREKYEPVLNSLFKVTFVMPFTVTAEPLLTEHVISCTGWRDPGPEAVNQQHYSARRNYASTDVDNTQNIEMTFSLNLNKLNQNYIAKAMRRWRKAVFNPLTGEYGIKAEYAGQIVVQRLDKKHKLIYQRTLHNAWPSGDITGLDDFDITNAEPVTLVQPFVGDYYTENDL